MESYKILKDIFSTKVQKEIIKEVIKDLKVKEINKSYSDNAPIINNPKYWDLITHEKILDSIRSYFNEEDICFVAQTSMQYNSPLGGFHRDNANRDFNIGSDWNEIQDKYKIVRVGIYFSERSKIPFAILPNSNKKENYFQRLEIKIYNKFIVKIRKYLKNPKLQPPSIILLQKCNNLLFDSGDCIFFDPRTLHQGGKINFEKPKIAMFFAYGVKNIHLKNFNNFLKNYGGEGKKIHYTEEDYPEEFKKYLKSKNLL